jgi:hypothetical protein
VKDGETEAELRSYRQGIGAVLTEIWMILRPILTDHPDLVPPELKETISSGPAPKAGRKRKR